jgi:hypothetical protein
MFDGIGALWIGANSLGILHAEITARAIASYEKITATHNETYP